MSSYVQGVSIQDLYLGSAATAAGASLIKLVGAHHCRVENVTMLGGYYGVHLQGSILNTFIDLRSGVNIGGFFAGTSTNRYWESFARRGDVRWLTPSGVADGTFEPTIGAPTGLNASS